MLKAKSESSQIQEWNYDRFEFYSPILQKDFHCGLFRPKTRIERSLYLLHGGGADDTQAVQLGLLPLIVDYFRQHSITDTQLVLPAIGQSFLHDHPSRKNSAFSSYFLNEIIPDCEAGTSITAGTRWICGWSMGGQAALNFFMRYPEKFAGVGVHFPTLVGFEYSDPHQQNAYALRQQVSVEMMRALTGGFLGEFQDSADFSNHDPLQLAQKKDPALWHQKKIYFDVGQKDDFGLAEGSNLLHEIFLEKKVPHRFEIVPEGRHDGPFILAQFFKMLGYLL